MTGNSVKARQGEGCGGIEGYDISGKLTVYIEAVRGLFNTKILIFHFQKIDVLRVNTKGMDVIFEREN